MQIASLTNADDIELEPALDQLLLNLVGDAVEADMALRQDRPRRLLLRLIRLLLLIDGRHAALTVLALNECRAEGVEVKCCDATAGDCRVAAPAARSVVQWVW